MIGTGWLSSARPLIALFIDSDTNDEGIRDEQRKFIKYNHLVANRLIFHNVVTMSNALERLVAEGYETAQRSESALESQD